MSVHPCIVCGYAIADGYAHTYHASICPVTAGAELEDCIEHSLCGEDCHPECCPVCNPTEEVTDVQPT